MSRDYNPADWYWTLGDNADKGVFSSARGLYVSETDERYVAWKGATREPSSMPTEAELIVYLSNLVPDFVAHTTLGLTAYAAAARYAKETGGILVNGMPVATDRASQAMIGNAFAAAKDDAAFATKWKGNNGAFVTLDSATILALGRAVRDHVNACFSKEADVVAGLNASPATITSREDVDAALATVTT